MGWAFWAMGFHGGATRIPDWPERSTARFGVFHYAAQSQSRLVISYDRKYMKAAPASPRRG